MFASELMGLRRSRSSDPRLSPRGPLVQLERGLALETIHPALSLTAPISVATPPPLSVLMPMTRVMEERHSPPGEILAQRQPELLAAVLREVRQGIQKFHDGAYGGDLNSSQKRLAEDIYQQLSADKDGSFWGYRDKFLNFSVAVGPIAYDGPLPCFCFKVSYPQQWTLTTETAWIAVFFTLREQELRALDLRTPDPLFSNRLAENLRSDSEPLVDPPPRPVEPTLWSVRASDPLVDITARSTHPIDEPVAAETFSERLERSRTYGRHADPLRSARLLDLAPSVTQATDGSAHARTHFGNPLRSGCPEGRVETRGYRDINGDLVTTRIDQATGEKTVSVQDSLGRIRSTSRPKTPRAGDRARSQEPFRRTVTEQCLDEFRSKAWMGRGDGLLAGRTLWPRPTQNFDDPAWDRPSYPDRHVYRSSRYLDDPLWRRSMAYLDDPLRRRSPPYLENPLWSRRSPQVGLV